MIDYGRDESARRQSGNRSLGAGAPALPWVSHLTPAPLSLENAMKEEWRPVTGWEGVNDVSDWGRVKRVKANKGAAVGYILKLRTCSGGYPMVQLSDGGIQMSCRVHRLVMASFSGPKPHGCEINHRDGDKVNNHITNLEYATRSENNRHKYRVLHRRNPSTKLTARQVEMIRDSTLPLVAIARQFSISASHVSSIRSGVYWVDRGNYKKLKEEVDKLRGG